MTPFGPSARRTGALLPIAVAAAGLAFLAGGPAGPAPGAAGDRYRAGEDAVERRALAAGEVRAVRARGLDHAAAVGLPTGPRVAAARLEDRFAGHVLDEVVVTDESGRRQALVRMRGDGRVVAAVRIGWLARGARTLDEGAAAARAGTHARALGLAVDGPPALTRDVDGGWRASWGRAVGGIPVLGDGATVTLFADGTFHAAAERERPLAGAPTAPLDQATAEERARRHIEAILGPADASLARLVGLRLAWVAPNDTFDGAAPDAPDPVLRLAWVAAARTSGPLAERLRALELYVDAGDGALLGGDLLR